MADELVIINNLPSAIKIGEDSSDATATAADILLDKTAYVNGKKITGTITSKESETYIPTTASQIIESGQYISGNQIIEGDINLISNNIKAGTTIFGVSGDTNVIDTTYNGDTASSSNMLKDTVAFVNGQKIIGICDSIGDTIITPSIEEQIITGPKILQGNKTLKILGDANLLSSNIKKGVSIFGVDGVLDSEGSSTIVDNKIMDTSSMTSSSEVYTYFNEGEDCYVSNVDDNTKYEKITDSYEFMSNTIACAYDTVGDISMAGISIRSVVENRGVLLKKFTLTSTHGLIYVDSLVSDWIIPTIQFTLIPPSAVTSNETNMYLNLDFSKKVFEKNIILSPKYNGQRLFLEVTGLPIGEYYPVILIPSKIEGNTAIISQIGILEM